MEPSIFLSPSSHMFANRTSPCAVPREPSCFSSTPLQHQNCVPTAHHFPPHSILTMSRCIGWHCLTTAQKFGIIFSVVVVAIVLAICWAYLLGRVASSQLQRSFITLPGGRRVQRNPNLPPTVSLGELPIAQRWPGQPPQIIYQPVIYSIDPQYATRAQPYVIAGPCQPVTQLPVAYVPAQPQARFPHSGQQEVQPPQMPGPPRQHPQHRHPHNRSNSLGRSPADGPEPISPSWSQRLNRAFGLPMGRASTIASSASSDTENRSLPASSREASPARETHCRRSSELVTEVKPEVSGEPTEASRDQSDVQSISTQASNGATVHSDDYDMVRESGTCGRFADGLDDNASNGGCKLDVEFYRSLSLTSDSNARALRTPSPRPPASVDLSSASDTLSNTSNFSPSPVSGTGLPWS